jgi:ABC-type multidrug transport system fused ATPase/permease subunit
MISSLFEIFSHIERLMDYLTQKRRDEAAWLGVLAAILVWFFGVIGVIIVILLADNYATKHFIDHPGSNIIYFGFLLALSLPVGSIAYYYAKKVVQKNICLGKTL